MPPPGRCNVLLLTAFAGFCAAMVAHGQEARSPQSNRVADLKGERTTLKTAADKPFAAYIVGPKDAPRGVLVVLNPAGLSDPAREWADELGKLGYRAISIDLYEGRTISDAGPARDFQSLDKNDMNAKYRAALEALNEPGRKLAVIGICAGGGQALEASLAAPDLLAATVSYYGQPAVDAKRLDYVRSPVLAVYGKRDASEPIKTFEAAMRQAGKVVEVQMFDRQSPCGEAAVTYKKESNQPSWQATRDFLNRHLK
jgi:carboxymethylenebutenolidase